MSNLKTNNYLLTGCTGILGSHILFELLRKSLCEKSFNHYYLIIRNNKKDAQSRLLQLLTEESRPQFMDDFSLEDCLKLITIIPTDLAALNLQQLSQYHFDTVVHSAGSTSLLTNEDAKNEVHTQNIIATKNLLQSIPQCVKQFIYISTAFSFGIQQHQIEEGNHELEIKEFRNPYEQSKYECEKIVRDFCIQRQIHNQIMRPSIICGRLIEHPLYETPKFDVFYAWPIFLNRFSKKCQEKFRIWLNGEGGLNIVPVDFVAKSIVYALQHPEIKELNIVNPNTIQHTKYIGPILEFFDITDYEYVNQKPTELTEFEQLYYKTVGGVFEKYITLPNPRFKNNLILKVMKNLNLRTQLNVEKNFMDLIQHAMAKEFRKLY